MLTKYLTLQANIQRMISSFGTGVALIAMLGCGGDKLIGNLTLPDGANPDTYWSLEVNHRSINLATVAPYDTVQLSVIPRTLSGDEITGVTIAPVYTVKDPFSLRVGADGLLTAIKPSYDRSAVIAKLTINGVTREDTAWVRIMPSAPEKLPYSLSMQPQEGDSAKWSFGFMAKDVTPVIRAVDGEQLYGLLVNYHSSNTDVAAFAEEGLMGFHQGKALITGTSYVYGVRLIDTVTYSITLPTLKFVVISEKPSGTSAPGIISYSPDTAVIGVGGIILFGTSADNKQDVKAIFEDPSLVTAPTTFPWTFYLDGTSGNVGPLAPGLYFGAGRQFNVPGVYVYHDGTNKAKGVIVVQQETP